MKKPASDFTGIVCRTENTVISNKKEAFSMSYSISTLSIIFMAVSAALSLLLPIAVIVVMGIKKRMNWKAMILGAVLFVVFVVILESLMHLAVLGSDPSKSPIYGNPLLYMLYGGFAAGIFEETARLLCFRFLVRVGENESIDTGISYGLGHGGIEAMLIGGLGTVSNLLMAIMYNSGALDDITSALDSEQLSAVRQGIESLRNTSPEFFLMGGIERMTALLLQISLSLFVLKAVSGKKWMYFVYAVLIHAGIDMFTLLYQKGIIGNIFLLEGVVFIGAVITAFFAFRVIYTDKKRIPA
jgi:uncharacterized membrane protein YhfC